MNKDGYKDGQFYTEDYGIKDYGIMVSFLFMFYLLQVISNANSIYK